MSDVAGDLLLDLKRGHQAQQKAIIAIELLLQENQKWAQKYDALREKYDALREAEPPEEDSK